MALFGLFARTSHSGVDHLAFRLAADEGPEAATRAVADAYGAWHLMSAFSVAIMAGWVVLAIGAFRSKVFGSGLLGIVRAAALGSMSLLPLGVQVLRDGQKLRPRVLAARLTVFMLLLAAMAFLGTLG